MRRTLFISFVLAVLSWSAAYGLQASSAKPHKGIVSAATSHKPATASHKKATHPSNHVTGRAPSHAPNRAPEPIAGHATGHGSGSTARHDSVGKYAAGAGAHPASHRQLSRTRRVTNSRRGASLHSKAKFRRAVNYYPARKRPLTPRSYEGTETAVAGRPNAADVTDAGASVAATTNAEATEATSATVAEPVHPSTAEAVALRNSLKTMPPPLRGSLESLTRQNEKTEADNLERIEDDSDLNDRIERGMLVPVPVSTALTINGKLPRNRRYCRPWTASFLSDLGRTHEAAFHRPFEVSSAVRTVAYQKQLERINGNATSAEGDIASPHLTGAAIDIAKQGMTRQEIGWMRAWLLPLEQAGMIDVEEEFRQSCFHITVYKSYEPPMPQRKKAVRAKAEQGIADRSGL